MDLMDILRTLAPAVVAAIASWWATSTVHHRELKKMELDYASRVSESRDDLAIELLANARNEIIAARSEMTGLREEINSLRALEQHFYHFQQALEHLSSVLVAETPEAKAAAERQAKAFLARMKRLQEAKGTIAQEAQVVGAKLSAVEREIRKEGGQV